MTELTDEEKYEFYDRGYNIRQICINWKTDPKLDRDGQLDAIITEAKGILAHCGALRLK